MAVEYNPRASLLPDNPGVTIQPVQAGGSRSSQDGGADKRGDPPGLKPVGWRSTPQTIPVNPQPFGIRASPTELRKLGTIWTQSLGPNIPSRRLPRGQRGDRVVVNALLNAAICSVYLIAPLRGDTQMASDIFHWAHQTRTRNPKAHIVFSEPIVTGATAAEAKNLYQSIRDLASKHPGGIFLVADEDSPRDMKLPLVDGIRILHPEISRTVSLGFIPDEDSVYQASERMLGCAMIQTSRISQMVRPEEAGGLYEIVWRKPISEYRADKDPKKKSLTHDVAWSAPPGWVTEISYISKHRHSEVKAMVGGDPPAKAKLTTPVVIGIQRFDIQKPTVEVEDKWKSGEFSEDEKAVLDLMELPTGTGGDNELKTLFLKGLAEEACGSEANTMLKPECGVYRYIMALRYYDLLEKRQAGTFTPLIGTAPKKFKSSGAVVGKPPEVPPGGQPLPGGQPPPEPPPGSPEIKSLDDIEAFIKANFKGTLAAVEHHTPEPAYPTVSFGGFKFGDVVVGEKKVNDYPVIHTAGAGNCLVSAILTCLSPTFRKILTDEEQNAISVALRPLLAAMKDEAGKDILTEAQKAQICRITGTTGEYIEDESGIQIVKRLGYNMMLFQRISNFEGKNINFGQILVPEKHLDGKDWICIYSTAEAALRVGAGSHYSGIKPKNNSYFLTYEEGKQIDTLLAGTDKARERYGLPIVIEAKKCKYQIRQIVKYKEKLYEILYVQRAKDDTCESIELVTPEDAEKYRKDSGESSLKYDAFLPEQKLKVEGAELNNLEIIDPGSTPPPASSCKYAVGEIWHEWDSLIGAASRVIGIFGVQNNNDGKCNQLAVYWLNREQDYKDFDDLLKKPEEERKAQLEALVQQKKARTFPPYEISNFVKGRPPAAKPKNTSRKAGGLKGSKGSQVRVPKGVKPTAASFRTKRATAGKTSRFREGGTRRKHRKASTGNTRKRR
jgi:hypothetical protein